MSGHAFSVGDVVRFRLEKWQRGGENGLYRVIGLLPAVAGHNQYRIQNILHLEERIGREQEMEGELLVV